MFRRVLGFGFLGLAVACAEPSSTLGYDAQTRTTATTITWSDGKPAVSISCELPGACDSRSQAVCKGGNYTVLKMENMPTRGDARYVRGPASVVVRCA